MKCLLAIVVACLGVAGFLPSARSAEPEKQAKAIFVKGFGAFSLIADQEADFRPKILQAFSRDAVSFAGASGEMNRERLIKAVQQNDIIYLSLHGGPIFKDMQTFAVAPSADNTNISPKGNSLITSQEIRDGLKGRALPRLVVVNGCESTDTEGVRDENRMCTAFGVGSGTRGRAFIGWPHSVEGRERDRQFAEFFLFWTTKKTDGSFPTLAEAVNATEWPVPELERIANPGKTIAARPTILGDADLRYQKDDPKAEKEPVPSFAGRWTCKLGVMTLTQKDNTLTGTLSGTGTQAWAKNGGTVKGVCGGSAGNRAELSFSMADGTTRGPVRLALWPDGKRLEGAAVDLVFTRAQ